MSLLPMMLQLTDLLTHTRVCRIFIVYAGCLAQLV